MQKPQEREAANLFPDGGVANSVHMHKEDIKAANKEMKYHATHATKSEHKAAKRVEETAML